jgi:hypothetical protein
MFRNTVPVAEPVHDDVMPPATEVIPLSVLQLDLGEPSTGWASHLADRDIEIVLDDLGRASVARSDARQLFDERREAEAHAREVAARQEREAVERDRAFRAALPTGLHWTDIPVGATAADLWAANEKDARPKRRTVLQDALEAGGGLVFHPIRDEEAS